MLGNLSCNVRSAYPTIDVMPSMLPKSHWEQFGAWLRKLRRDAELTQKQVAEGAGIHEVQLARIEKGESGTKRETVIALAKALNVDESTALNHAGYASVQPLVIRHILPLTVSRRRRVESAPQRSILCPRRTKVPRLIGHCWIAQKFFETTAGRIFYYPKREIVSAFSNNALAFSHQKQPLFVVAVLMKSRGNAKFRADWIGDNPIHIIWGMIVFNANILAHENDIITRITVWLGIRAGISAKLQDRFHSVFSFSSLVLTVSAVLAVYPSDDSSALYRSRGSECPADRPLHVQRTDSQRDDARSLSNHSAGIHLPTYYESSPLRQAQRFGYISSLRGQLLVGDATANARDHKAIETLERVKLDVSIVETERKFVDVTPQMLFAGVMIHASQAAFEQRPDAFYRVRVSHSASVLARRMIHRFVGEEKPADAAVSPVFVSAVPKTPEKYRRVLRGPGSDR
jgi:transcriptional regulator with XRE-family HTH domain